MGTGCDCRAVLLSAAQIGSRERRLSISDMSGAGFDRRYGAYFFALQSGASCSCHSADCSGSKSNLDEEFGGPRLVDFGCRITGVAMAFGCGAGGIIVRLAAGDA